MQHIIQKILKDTIYYGPIPVFIYTINYPSFTTTCNPHSAYKINAYYYLWAKNLEQYCRSILYPLALESARYIKDERPFNSYTLDAIYEITYNSGCLTSLYTDTYTYMGGAHGETKRTSNTWNFKTGEQYRLKDIYPGSFSDLQKNMEQQTAERLSATPGSYFDNYGVLLKESFHPQSYYLQPDNFIIYYQQYDIAPYSSGLPEFTFPLSLLNLST